MIHVTVVWKLLYIMICYVCLYVIVFCRSTPVNIKSFVRIHGMIYETWPATLFQEPRLSTHPRPIFASSLVRMRCRSELLGRLIQGTSTGKQGLKTIKSLSCICSLKPVWDREHWESYWDILRHLCRSWRFPKMRVTPVPQIIQVMDDHCIQM